MDYHTARKFILNQGNLSTDNKDNLPMRLERGEAPIPGQITNILLALKIIFENCTESENLERELVYPLYCLAYESRQRFEAGRKVGVNWPPLLDEDLQRIAIAVGAIFSGVWH